MKVCEKEVAGFCPKHLEGKKLPFPQVWSDRISIITHLIHITAAPGGRSRYLPILQMRKLQFQATVMPRQRWNRGRGGGGG